MDEQGKEFETVAVSPIDAAISSASSRARALAGVMVDHLARYWLKYAALCVTAFLTGHAAWFWTGSPFYTVAAVALSEGAFLFWLWRVPENGNKVQMLTDGLGTALSFVAIAGTVIVSAWELAVNAKIGLLTEFSYIPPLIQRWGVLVVPVLAACHIALLAVFEFYDEDAVAARAEAAEKREAERKISEARRRARVLQAQAAAEEYARRAEGVARESGRAIAEKRLRGDFGDGDSGARLENLREAGVPPEGARDDAAPFGPTSRRNSSGR